MYLLNIHVQFQKLSILLIERNSSDKGCYKRFNPTIKLDKGRFLHNTNTQYRAIEI